MANFLGWIFSIIGFPQRRQHSLGRPGLSFQFLLAGQHGAQLKTSLSNSLFPSVERWVWNESYVTSHPVFNLSLDIPSRISGDCYTQVCLQGHRYAIGSQVCLQGPILRKGVGLRKYYSGEENLLIMVQNITGLDTNICK